MGPLQIILTVLEVLVSIGLVVVVLFQSGKESGVSALSGNSDSYMSKGNRSSLDAKLAAATKWIGLVWVLITLGLCLAV